MASINFLSENIDIKKIVSADSKIDKMTVNPITYHTTVEIEGKSHSFDLKVLRTPDGGFTVTINGSNLSGTIPHPFHTTHSELDSALREILTNWEKVLAEKKL